MDLAKQESMMLFVCTDTTAVKTSQTGDGECSVVWNLKRDTECFVVLNLKRERLGVWMDGER